MSDLSSKEVLKIFQECQALINNTHVVLTRKPHPEKPDKLAWFHSSEYVNKDALFTNPHALMKLCKAIADYWWGEDVEVIASPAIGAVSLALLTAYWYRPNETIAKVGPVIPVYAEKEGDVFVFKRGFDKFIPDKRVLVVEDIASSGGSAKRVVEAVRKLGGEVLGVSLLWNRGNITAEDLGVPQLHSLIQSKIHMYLAEKDNQCSLCQKRIPINKEVGKWREFLEEKAEGNTDFATWCISQLDQALF
ncbi:MAG: phosphoribosyltransferase [Patescibacteria group bacterium]|nr:phosphoribosyltransferase [Patescibacteria group bacterium]